MITTPRERLGHKLRDGKYRARQAGCPIEPIDLDKACEVLLATNTCYLCGITVNLVARAGYALEHKTPLICRGPHALENLGKSCMHCNEVKHEMDEFEYLDKIGRL